jgi:hypothetical protein
MSIIFDSIFPQFSVGEVPATDYPWDGWQSTTYFMFIDDAFYARLMPLSDAAATSFALAITEWICARYFQETRTREVLEYIDAVWAASLCNVPVAFIEFPDEDWQGPVLGPLRFAQLIAADLQFEARGDGDFGSRACWAYNLAAYVIGAHKPAFDRWIDECFEVLERHHRLQKPIWNSIFDTEFANDDRCPPNAFCRFGSYDPAKIQQYIDEHMSRVRQSVYLTKPHELFT